MRVLVSTFCLCLCLLAHSAFAAPSVSLPPLPYPYNYLEPYFDEQTMRYHHNNHHQTYVNKLNDALAKLEGLMPSLAQQSVPEILRRLDKISDEALRKAIRNNGGGHVNHALFWESLTRSSKTQGVEQGGVFLESTLLGNAILEKWGSFHAFQREWIDKSLAFFGSGWTWLQYSPKTSSLSIVTLPNQDSPYMTDNLPILGLDLWEHAYYLKHQNRKLDYYEDWFEIVNWAKANKLYEEALSSAAPQPEAPEDKQEL
eukprot:TRINITY_DN20546_c0_g2_i1.p1 TRINITY_DN20546_c0_g2~~TRINITY_DN20546_c0_g2_i1.p1  ORF type:complete len:257 (-),score=47.16 TRINITY_DN20546_c0_g2_i1:50-820(-)